MSAISGKFSLTATEYTPPTEGIFSGHAWEFSNPEALGIRRITVWKPHDNSFIVSAYMPISLSEKVARELLPKQTILMEAVPEDWPQNPKATATEWVGKVYDKKDCYVLLSQMSSSLEESAVKIVDEIMTEMKKRYHCETMLETPLPAHL